MKNLPACFSPKIHLKSSGFLTLALFLAATSAQAANATWGSNTTGNWSVGSNWTSSNAPGQLTSSGTSTADIATFNNAAGATLITIDSPWNIKSVTFGTGAGAYTIGSTGGNALTLTTGGTISSSVSTTQTINAPLVIGNAGGQAYTLTSTSGILNLGGSITSAGSSGTTTLTTSGGGGRINITGNITDSGSGTITALDVSQTANTVLNLTGTNTFSGTLTQRSADLRGIDGVGFSSNANLFVAGTASNNNSIETNGNFTRSFGSGAGQISFASGTNLAFSAVGGDLVIAFGGLVSPTQINLGTTNQTYGNIWLNNTGNQTGKVTLMNAINLNGHNLTLGGQGSTTSTRGTVAGVISGTGTGSGSTINIGGITSWVQLTGANTFDGPMRVGENSTLYVNSIGNWSTGNTTASNLGSPTSAANGLIHLGNSSTGSGMLVYQGTGETTNRQISFEWDNGGITQSGTGLLKITDFIFHSPSRNNFTLRFNLLGDTAGAGEISGNITDDNIVGNQNYISVIKNGTGTWTLSGTNTYTKPTTITAGTLQFAKQVSLYNNGAAATWNSTNIVVASGATLGLNVGGTGEFTTSDVSTLAAVLPSGAFIGLDGTNGTGGSYSYNSVLSAPSGVGLNVLGNITLTQANTYTGSTKVSSGSLTIGANAPSGSAGALGNASSAVTLGSANAEGAAAILTNGAYTVARNITEASSSANSSLSIGGSQTSGTSTYTGNIILTKDTTLTSASGGEVDFTTGVISGAFNAVIDGGGTVKLTGTNTFGGSGKSVAIQGGTTLIAATSANLGNSSNSLIFNNGTLQLDPSFDPSTKTMTFNSGGATFDTNGSDSTFANAVGNSGAGGLTKVGSGALTLAAANTYNGVTTISAGKITLKNNSGLGTTSGGTVVSSGAALAIDGTAGNRTVGAEALTLNGAGVTGSPAGALQNVAGTNTYGGLVTLGSDATIQSDAGSLALSNTGTITGSGNTLTVKGSGNGSIASVIGTGAGGLTKSGSGTWTVSGANTYTGTTAVTLGTLVVANTSALGGGGPVNISSGATLKNGTGGDFTFSNNVTNNGTINANGDHNIIIAAGKTLNGSGLLTDSVGGGLATFTVMGTLSPGNSPGTVTVDTNVTLALDAGATTFWQLAAEVADGSGGTPGISWDSFALNTDSTMSLNGALQISLDGISFSADSYWQSSHTYTIFTGAGVGGQVGLFSSITGDSTYTNLNGTGTFAYTGGDTLSYNWVAVPEPQTWALAALGVSAVLFRLRRKQRSE